ncbi:Bgt-20392 [Blumeria graminis f. sp. tritici]|uniref:Bgt-20392 n=1 Tax=Blumeria graminis f. sp. tritici TaxID=62690 RepID=A0A9X9MLD2_BLUGR|nr:Bgt-20392 [Blumeria graminis f. sp. tritici]
MCAWMTKVSKRPSDGYSRWRVDCLCKQTYLTVVSQIKSIYYSSVIEDMTEHLHAVSSTNLGVKYLPRANFSQISQYLRSMPTR